MILRLYRSITAFCLDSQSSPTTIPGAKVDVMLNRIGRMVERLKMMCVSTYSMIGPDESEVPSNWRTSRGVGYFRGLSDNFDAVSGSI